MVMGLWTHKYDIDFQSWFIYSYNEIQPPMKVILACPNSMLFIFRSTAGEKSNVAGKFKFEQMYLHLI